MSYGTVICSVCKRELRQDYKTDWQTTFRRFWVHDEAGSPMCPDAQAIYPPTKNKYNG
jgi:hypothetical protein